MWWILVWVLLVVGAAAVIGLLLWRLVKQALALGRQLADTAGTLGEATAAARGLPREPAPSSVFLDPDSQPSVQQRSRGTRRRKA
ncbi:MAG TPA: hypothetical protein VF661_08825 [Actinomycetales bacterium]